MPNWINDLFKKLVIVMCGGSLGAASRYTVSLLTARFLGSSFPYGTLAVNLAGCFLIGFIFALAERFRMLTPDIRLLIITGYLGALTTFSSYSLETLNAARTGMVSQAVMNILINNIGGLGLTFLGLLLGSLKY